MPNEIPAPPGARPCILIVEDDSAVRRSLQLRLRAAGFDVRAYAAASAALADPASRAAACLIADLVMQEIDGMRLLRTLREDGWKGPAILISGFLDDALSARALAASFSAVLDKPLADERLMETLSALVDRPAA